jgi:hypothetical protein
MPTNLAEALVCVMQFAAFILALFAFLRWLDHNDL